MRFSVIAFFCLFAIIMSVESAPMMRSRNVVSSTGAKDGQRDDNELSLFEDPFAGVKSRGDSKKFAPLYGDAFNGYDQNGVREGEFSGHHLQEQDKSTQQFQHGDASGPQAGEQELFAYSRYIQRQLINPEQDDDSDITSKMPRVFINQKTRSRRTANPDGGIQNIKAEDMQNGGQMISHRRGNTYYVQKFPPSTFKSY